MVDKKILKDTEKFIKSKLTNEYSGHDWWHIQRVINLSLKIAKTEKCNSEKVYITALLHDLFDEKIFKIDNKKQIIEDYFKTASIAKELSKEDIASITNDLLNLSFRGSFVSDMLSTEGKIVQDADRIDAIGAIGIARTFAYGGNKKHYIYNPQKAKEFDDNEDQISHFYIKLLNIKDNLNTKSAKKIASKRHKFMEAYLKEFFEEWNDDFEL